MADLHATLDELSGLIQGEHPELAGRLRPGRSDEEIAALAEDLHLLAHVGPRLAAERREVLSLAPLEPAADELVVTIAELLRDRPADRPIRAELRGWGGAFDAFVATASDGTGSLDVLLTRDQTENFREFAGGERFDVWLAPADREAVANLATVMRGLAELPAVAYVATRIVPL